MSTNEVYQYCRTHHYSLKPVDARHHYLVSWLSKNPQAIGFQGELFPEVFLPDRTSIDLAGFYGNAVLIGEVKTGKREPRARNELTDFAERLAIREDLDPSDIGLFYLWTRGSAETAGIFSKRLSGKQWKQREIQLPEEYHAICKYSYGGNITLLGKERRQRTFLEKSFLSVVKT